MPILNLTLRLSTDDQYNKENLLKIKEYALEINQAIEDCIGKAEYLN